MRSKHKMGLALLLAMLFPALVSAEQPTLEQPQRIRVVADFNYPPLMSIDSEGQGRGYLVDWWALWSEKTGIEIELAPMLWANALNEMKSGRADVIDTIFRTPQREAYLSFSEPYLEVPVSIYAHREIIGLKAVRDLHGFRLGVMQGDACIDVLENAGIKDLKRYRDYRSVIQAALANEVKVFCMDNLPAEYYLYQQEAHDIYTPAFELYKGQFRLGVQKGNTEMLALLQRGRIAITAEEEQALREKWLPIQPRSRLEIMFLKYQVEFVVILLLITLMLSFWLWSTKKVAVRRKQKLQKTDSALRERLKEQNCLHAIYKATEDLDKPLVDVVRELATLLPAGWQYTDIAAAQVQLDDHTYPEVISKMIVAEQRASVSVEGKVHGWVTVWYTQERPEAFEGPFLQEERTLIENVASRLSEYLLRRRAEKALQESEARFRAFFDNTRQAIALIENGLFISANQASLDMLGFDQPNRLVGKSPVDISPRLQPDGESSQRKAERLIAQALTQGSARFEWQHVRADGQPVLLDVLLTAITGQQHQIIHVVWTDITDKKAAEQALINQQKNLEKLIAERTQELSTLTDSLMAAQQEQNTIYNTATVGIVLIRDRIIKLCNQATQDIFGYSSEDMLGRTTRMWYPDEASFLDTGERIMQAQRRGRYFADYVEFVRKDGRHFWAHVNARALDQEDLSKGVVGIIADVTKERAAEEKLKQAFLQQEAILNTATAGIMLIQDRKIQRCNHSLGNLTGYESSELVGQSTHLLCNEKQEWMNISNEMAEEVRKGETFKRSLKIRRKDGTWFWSRLSARAINASDLEQGVVAMLEDITLEQQAFESLESAKRIAEEAVQTKADFLANMSHEIRTPMNAIIGMTHMALRTELDAKQRGYLEKIRGSGQHLLGIINDILDLSKIEAGKLSLEQTQFNLERVLVDVTSFISEKAADKSLELILDIPDNAPRVLTGDPLRISQVLLNLANNAVKFTEHGEVAIRVRLEKELEKSVALRFEVTDTGIGLSEEQCEKLFQSFHQADSSTTRKYGGTGLGLSISKRIVEAMGGSIGVDSEEGVGSTFWFSITLDKAQQQPALPVPEPDLRGRRILVVDDNDNAREVLTGMLHSMSFNADSASSGQQALEALRQADQQHQGYDLVLLDWKMPQMDGIETARQIAELSLDKQPVCAMITAYGLDDLLDKAQEAAITTVLSKPVTPSSLFDAAITLLGGGEFRERHSEQVHEDRPADLADIAGAHLLLVEDNELNQYVACELLASTGFTVDVAENGQVALDMLQKQHYDLVLMDMQMPVMDGLTATRKIRQQYSLKDLPVVAMTANAMASDRVKCIDAGMNDFLPKPIDPEKVWVALRRWIKPVSRKENGFSIVRDHPSHQSGSVPPVDTIQKQENLAAVVAVDENISPIAGNNDEATGQLQSGSEHQVCNALLQILANDDYGSEAFLEQHEEVFRKLLGEKVYKSIYSATANFDYHKAHERLKAAMTDAGLL